MRAGERRTRVALVPACGPRLLRRRRNRRLARLHVRLQAQIAAIEEPADASYRDLQPFAISVFIASSQASRLNPNNG